MVGGEIVEESPTICGVLVATSVLWAAATLGLEMVGLVCLGLAGAMVLGCCSDGLTLAGVMVWAVVQLVWLGQE